MHRNRLLFQKQDIFQGKFSYDLDRCKGYLIYLGGKQMKFLKGLYVVMALMVFVNLSSEFIFDGAYSAIASWAIVMLFVLGTVFFANAHFYLNKK